MIDSGANIWQVISDFTGRDDFSAAVEGDEITPASLELLWTGKAPEIDEVAMWQAIEASREKSQYTNALTTIRDTAEEARQSMIGNAAPIEVSSWPNKAARAHRFLAGAASIEDEQALSLEASARSQSTEALAGLQVLREGQYATAIALIDGWQHGVKRAIKEAPLSELSKIVAASKENLIKDLEG